MEITPSTPTETGMGAEVEMGVKVEMEGEVGMEAKVDWNGYGDRVARFFRHCFSGV